jgi:5'-nucleotidase
VHGGGKCGDWKNPLDTSSCDERTGEVFEMLNGLPPTTVDAVIAGHTHNVIGHFVHGTPVVETFGLGRWFSTIELYVDAKTRSIVGDKTKITPLQPICETVDETSKTCDTRTLKAQGKVKPVPATFHGKKIVAHTEVAKVIEPAIKKVAELQEKQLGLSVPQILGRNYENESPLGDFLADSLKDLEKADVALLNPGGLRADLKPGPVTYGEVYEVLPFDNAIATLQLSADELRRLLNAAYGSRKGVFQVAGLKVTLSRCPTPDRLKNVTLETGKPLEQRTYRVVMPDFLARGGDGLGPVLSTIEPTRVDLGVNREKNLRDALVDHWQKKKESFGQPKPGRVSFLSDDGACSSGTKLDGQTGVP